MPKGDYFALDYFEDEFFEFHDKNFDSTIKKIETKDGDIIISINKIKKETIKLFKKAKFTDKD